MRKRKQSSEVRTGVARPAASYYEFLCATRSLSRQPDITMWPNQGPPPPVGSPNPAYPPGYTSTYPSAPPYPAYPAAPQHPTYPAAPAPGAFSHPGQYPAGMYPAAMGPTAPPGAMPYPAPGLHPYPVTPCGYPVVPPPCVYGPYPHSPKWGHHKSHHKVHHHGAVNPMSGALVAMRMGLVGHKANKKMMKKMKKAHKKQRKMNNCGKYSSSSDSD